MDNKVREPEKGRFKLNSKKNDQVKSEVSISNNKQQLTLEGLGCANCAAKIETRTQGVMGINNATVDFATRKLTFEIADKNDLERILNEVTSIVRKIEPDVRVVPDRIVETADAKKNSENTSREYETSRKKEIAKLVIGGILFALGLIIDFPKPVELALFLTSYAIVGGSVVFRAVKGIRYGQVFSEHFLMSVATIGAFFVGSYAEGVAVMLFYLIGELFQDMAVDHSRKSIADLMDIRPDYANLKRNGELVKVSPEVVKIGDTIIVKPGEKIPLDGIVIEGASMVDTAALTGESVPRQLESGSVALSGFINRHGVLTIEVNKDFANSTVSKILDLVQNASSRKAPTEKFITKFARYYTPVVVFMALAMAVIPPLAIPGATFADWIYKALIFLVVSCPCALVISIPLGFFGGIGGLSKRGILVKGSNYLEALNQVEMVVFDKTGTLTKGIFEITTAKAYNNYSRDELIECAAYAESHSNHPIALSIQKAFNQAIDSSQIESYEELAGLGTKALVAGKTILAGNGKLMELNNIKYPQVDSVGSVVHIAINNNYAGYLVISDEVKEDSAMAIKSLKSLGIDRIIMLTGDLKEVGEKFARQLGLDEVYSELLPDAKVEKIESLEKEKSIRGKIVFVGDGINDAPVLARADVGIAMGGLGSDAAIEAADVVIMNDEPTKVVTAIRIARRTRTIVFQNIFFALGVKAIFLVFGAMGLASMWEAVFADMGVALIAIFNSIRVINTKNI